MAVDNAGNVPVPECGEATGKKVAIIGGGPGGYTAALYAARAGLDTLVLEKLSAGGQMALTTQIDNYPGFEAGIDGFTLGEKMQQGAERFGAKTEIVEVDGVHLQGPVKTVHTNEGIFAESACALPGGDLYTRTAGGHGARRALAF